jgi:hypothetical protein
LPHSKYIQKINKLHLKKKNEAIEFIKIDKHQVEKAVKCLTTYDQAHKNVTDLFADDGFIYLELDLDQIPEHYSIKPVQIPLPFPIYSEDFNSRLTIFSCDP